MTDPTKAELLKQAEADGIEVDPKSTKAEIKAAIEAAASQADSTPEVVTSSDEAAPEPVAAVKAPAARKPQTSLARVAAQYRARHK